MPVVRIRRVTDTLIASRNIVVSSSSVGKAENSSALLMYIVATTIARAPEMLQVIMRSSTIAGSGITSIETISTTPIAAIRSVCLSTLRSVAHSCGDSPSTSHLVDECQHLRHGGEQLGRDHPVDLDHRVQ